MVRFYILGIGLGLAFTAWFVLALVEGEVNVNLSGLHLDYTTLSRAEQPGKYWAAIGAVGGVLAVYWSGLVWFLRRARHLARGE